MQDFYAHSTWSELKGGAAEPFWKDLGLANSQGNIGPKVAPANEESCAPNHASPAVVTAMRLLYGPVTLPNGLPNPLAISANAYANYAENSDLKPGEAESLILLGVGGGVLKKMLTFENSGGNWNVRRSNNISSGYFEANQHLYLGIGSGTDRAGFAKCDHGFNKGIPGLKSTLAGINKDAPWSPFSPSPHGGDALNPSDSSPLHALASYQAALATRQIYQNVIDAIEEQSGYKANKNPETTNKRDIMVQLFMGMKPTVAFVVDTTGSMQDIMDGVAQQVDAIAKRETNADSGPNRPLNLKRKFMLTTYSEDTKNNATIEPQILDTSVVPNGSRYGSAGQVVAKLKSLPLAKGGGDCAEPTMAALLQTVRRVPMKSKIYVFTDASSKNANNESAEITNLISKKKLEVTFSVSGSCSPIDENYKNIAKNSGGQLLLVDHTSADTAVALAGVEAGSTPMSLIHLERGKLNVGTRKEIAIPVESGVNSLLLSVTSDVSNSIVIKDPNGKVQNILPFLGGGMLKISQPIAGIWSVSVSGYASGTLANEYSVKAQAIGAFDLGSVMYSSKDQVPNAPHDQYQQYGTVPPTTTVRMQAKLTTNAANNPNTYIWQAIAEDGSVLGNLDVSRRTPDQYEGVAAIDSISANGNRSWLVRVSGLDANGKPFARVMPSLQRASKVFGQMEALPTYWLPGGKHRLKLNLENFAEADGFTVSAKTSVGQVQVFDGQREIAAKSKDSFFIDVAIPANATTGNAGAISITISSRIGAALATHNIPLSILADQDSDGVPDINEQGENGNNSNYDGNGDGIPDWKQAEVISLHSQNHRAYLTASLSIGKFKLVRPLAAANTNASYGLDLLDLKVVGLQAGAASQMTITLPTYMSARGFDMYGAENGNAVSHWYNFNYSEASKTGAKISKNLITLYLQDGAKGDNDLLANGEVSVQGGPSDVFSGANAGSSADQTPTPTPNPGTATIPPAGGSSGGGGCTVGQPGQNDMSLPLLSVLALAGIAYRRRRSAARAKR